MWEALGLIAADRRRSAAEGLGTRQPVLEAQAELAAVERQLAESRENLATALLTLRLLCGSEPVLPALGTSFRELAPQLDEELLAERADSGSLELEIAELRRGQALERLRLEKGGASLRPDLSLALTLEVSGQEVPWSSAGWTDTWDWDLMLSLGTRVKLYDGGEAESRLGQARAEAEAAGAVRQQAEKFLRLRVRQAVQEARLAALEVQEKQARLAAAAERWRNALSAYENQLLTRSELAAAQAARGAAALEQLAAGYRLELALAALERLAGPISPGSGS
jgi:outer membrane protein TolC